MVLAYLFKELRDSDSGFEFQVAHVNYKLRDEDSDLDQKVVQGFCEKTELHFMCIQFPKRTTNLKIRFSFGQGNFATIFSERFGKRKI